MLRRILHSLVLAAALSAAAGGAMAQSDTFCISQYPTGVEYWGCVTIPAFVPTNIYLCLRHPSGNQVLAWEARVTHSNAASMIGSWVISGMDINPDPENFVVGCATPLLPNEQDIVMLGWMQVIILNANDLIQFFIGPVPGSTNFPQGTPGYVHTEGVNTPANTCSGNYDFPVFQINGCYIDAVEGVAWGDIKQLYGR
jgi:hypothetical protein